MYSFIKLLTLILTSIFIIQSIVYASPLSTNSTPPYKIVEIYRTSYEINDGIPYVETTTPKGGLIQPTVKLFYNNKKFQNNEFDGAININTNAKKQKIWGFGGSITQACIENVADLTESEQNKFFETLFNGKVGAGLNFLRIPLGGNDFSTHEYTLNDSKTPDPHLTKMDMSSLVEFVRFAKIALKQNPNIHFMVSPWSPPAWMKDSNKLRGGQLLKQYYPSYAIYLAKAIEFLESQGISIDYLTLLNEPLIGEAKTDWYFQQAYMEPQDQEDFISNHLLPTLIIRNVKARILAHDHNWDNANELTSSLTKPNRFSKSIKGVAYHCYGGDMNNLKSALKVHPNHVGFNTECSGELRDNTDGYYYDFQWWLMTQSLDALNEGMTGGLGWNLCLDQNGGPKSNGCQSCRGLVTIDKNASRENDRIVRNPELMALAQTSKYVDYGSTRVESTLTEGKELMPAAFINTKNQLVLVVRNPEAQRKRIKVYADNHLIAVVTAPALGAATVVFAK